MFHLESSNTHLQKQNQPNNNLNSLQKKNQQYRKNIRRQQIEQKLKAMRQEIFASLSQDYHVLKNINLNEVFHHFMNLDEFSIEDNWKDVENITNDIFIYSRSDQSDHLYYMFDERTLHKLIKLLQINRIESYKRNPRTYIRILWILANYTSYSSERLETFEAILITLFKQITQMHQFYSSKSLYKLFSHSQTRQILEIALFSISNQALNADYLMNICLKPIEQRCFIDILMRQFQKIVQFTKLNSIKETLIPSIMSKILSIFETTLKFTSEDDTLMSKMYGIDFKIVNMLLELLSIFNTNEKQTTIEYQITVTIRQFLFAHLFLKPQIIISHNFTIIFEMFTLLAQRLMTIDDRINNYDCLLEIEGEAKPSITSLKKSSQQMEKRLHQLLECIFIIFGLNFPEEGSDQFYETYQKWLENNFIPTLRKIFKVKWDNLEQIYWKCLQILRNICLEQDFCDLILGQLAILNKIFYYIRSQATGIRLRKAALSVLNSIICISLEGQSDLRMEVIEMLNNNKIIEIFTLYIGEYVDEQLNMNLLKSLLLYLRTQASEDKQDHLIWRKFCEEDGVYRLQKYHSDTKNQEIQHLIEQILQQFNK